jgi:hypothetical protein
VTLYDGKPVPKVIDFGVAKATEQPLTERTLFTQYGTIVGTLEYMSPEQAEMSGLGVDTRGDIYSLGVLLYELLTGSTPLERPRLRAAAYAEVLRLIREEEAPKPSTRLSSSDTLPAIAAARKTEPAKLARLVRGELDWIVLKALEKDRTRRYETASRFAADVQHYLDDEPVEACPPSAWYRFRKFARRNKAALATAAVVSVALVLAVATLAVSTVLIYREQKQTEAALGAEARQRERAEANFREALDAVDQMLTEVGQEQLAQVPHLEQVRRTLLEKALKFYDKFLKEKSDVSSIYWGSIRRRRRPMTKGLPFWVSWQPSTPAYLATGRSWPAVIIAGASCCEITNDRGRRRRLTAGLWPCKKSWPRRIPPSRTTEWTWHAATTISPIC